MAEYLPRFLLVLLRAGIFTAMLPLVSSRNFPAQFRIGFAIAMAVVITPIAEVHMPDVSIPVLVLREVMLGIVLGAAARLAFYAVEIAGYMMSTTMGLSAATLFNPEFGQSTEVSRFYGILAILIVFATDAHHDLIYVFVKSYEILPVGQVAMSRVIVDSVASVGSGMFILAAKLSAPVVVGIMITHIMLGFVYKAAPQINIFFVSYPVYMFLGFVIMILSLPFFTQVFSTGFGELKGEMFRILAQART